jgi:nicotinamide mononucleotide transporter
MTALVESLRDQLFAWSPAEAVAVACAVLYLLLAIRENIWCWLFAGVSTAIYTWLFLHARLYMESALNVFYFGMAIYGWRVWLAGRGDAHEMPVTTWPVRVHGTALVLIAALVLVTGTLLSRYTDAAFPFIDSATTYAAIWATFLVARKVLENWWYWLVIDVVSIFIYWSRDLELTALLFVAYVIMIPFGLISWTRSYRGEPHAVAT